MRKVKITVIVVALASLTSFQSQQEERKFPQVKKLSEYKNTDFLPTLEHKIDRRKNAVYCATLLYAWEEIRKQISLPLTLSPEDTDLTLLNNSKSFINVLKSNEYTTSVEVKGNTIKAKQVVAV